jgi:single-stranded-DNA-specific exonuclease
MAEIKNLKKVAERIKKAIKNKEKIILCGDADLDGTAAVIILKETIQDLGGEIFAIYFPDREIEGHGITETALNHLKKFAPALLLALDFGIGNFKEVKLAKKLGFEVIIIDHHQVLDKLPAASIVVDPQQKGDKYPFKGLAVTAIIFKLSELLLKDKIVKNLRRNFLELVALATIADMMPQEEENKIFIEEGLESLENSWRPGIRAFFETEPFKGYNNLNQKVSKIISILNVRDVERGLPASFRLLTCSSSEESRVIIEKLLKKSELRREKIKGTAERVKEKLSKKNEEPIIFEGDSAWDFTLISPVASIICQKYQKPTFIFKKLEKEAQGTVRTPSGIDSVSLMKKCSKYLLTYGGHPLAAGFRIKNEDLENFKKCLIKNLQRV